VNYSGFVIMLVPSLLMSDCKTVIFSLKFQISKNADILKRILLGHKVLKTGIVNSCGFLWQISDQLMQKYDFNPGRSHAQFLQHVLRVATYSSLLAPHSSCQGSRGGAVVRALGFHPCGPGSIPRLGVIGGLSLLSVLVVAPRGFSLGTPVFLCPQKPTFQIPI